MEKLECFKFPLLALVTASEKGGRIDDLVQVLAACDSINV